MKTNVKKMVITALLIAISLIIPIVFGPFLKVYIPPFSATLAAHVPMFVAMYLGAFEASVVGVGSALGFLLAIPDPIVALRATSHIIVGFIGAKLTEKNMSYRMIVAITSPIHGLIEAVMVYLLTQNLFLAFIVTGIGTILHHIVDGVIALPVLKLIKDVMRVDLKNIGVKQKEVSI